MHIVRTATQQWQGVSEMPILEFFRENIHGNIKSIYIKSFSTGYTFLTESTKDIMTKDLVIEPVIGLCGD